MRKLTSKIKLVSFLLINIFFWIGVYFFYTYFLGYGSSNTVYVNSFSIYLMPVTIIVSYFVVLYLIPKFLLKKKYKLFVLYGLYTFIISFSLIILSIFYGLIFTSYLKDVNTVALTKSLSLIILGIYFVIIITTVFSLLIYSYISNLKNEDLKNKFLQTQLQLKEQELRFLKMQIHPHFLFNSLNTIYGFALKKKDETPEMILKLSNLLDYILYQVDKPTVDLQDEVNHLEDYISLEEMRFNDTLVVEFEKEDFNGMIQIAPMLLIPFLENSFKHGKILFGKLQVKMKLHVNENTLHFIIENTADETEDFERGIGLSNIKRRLKMLYPNAHEINVKHSKNAFIVKLKIKLKELKIERDV